MVSPSNKIIYILLPKGWINLTIMINRILRFRLGTIVVYKAETEKLKVRTQEIANNYKQWGLIIAITIIFILILNDSNLNNKKIQNKI